MLIKTFSKTLLVSAIACSLFACQSVPTTMPHLQKSQDTPTSIVPLVQKTDDDMQFEKDESRHEYRLQNGLKVIIKEDHRAPVVISQIWYKVGSNDEPEDKGGIAHLLEHMMFKGTEKVSSSDFDRLVAKFGGNNNAFTSYDYTGYYETFPSNRLGLALELEADRMTNLQFDEQQFKSEREVVMEERRQRTDDNPLARAYEKFREMAYPDSPKGQSVIGPMQEIQGITLNDLKSWYRTWYAPNNATIVIVGDVHPEDVMQKVVHYFGNIKPAQTPQRPAVSQQGMRGYQQSVIAESVNVPTLLMAFNVPTLSSAMAAKTPVDDAYELLLLQYVMDGGYAAHFEKTLIREQGKLASIASSYSLYDRGDGLFMIEATPREGVSLQQVEDAILAEIDGFKTNPISQKDIDRARSNILKGFIFSQDSIAGQANIIGSFQSRGLDDRLISLLPNKLAQISGRDLNQVAQKYLIKDNLTVMHIEPHKKR